MALQALPGVPQQSTRDFPPLRSRRFANSLVKFGALGVAVIFSFAAQPAFAQHGGGGGHAGGGGGHIGGGGHASGGSSARSSSASTRASAPRSSASTSAAGSAKPVASSSRSANRGFVSRGPYVLRLGPNSGASADAIPSTQRVIPYHVTIGFAPKENDTNAPASGYVAVSNSVAGEPGNDSLSRSHAQPVTYYGVGDEAWSEPAHTVSAAPSNAAFVTVSAPSPQHATAHASAPAASAPRSSAPATASPRPAPVRSPSSAPQAPRVISGARTSPFVASSSLAHAQAFPRNPRRRGPSVIVIYPPGYPIYPFGPFGFGGFGYGGGYFGYGLWPWWFDNGMDYSPEAGAAFADPCAPTWFEGCDAYYSGNGAANGEMSGDVPVDNTDADSIAAQKMADNEHNVWLPPDTPEREQNAITAEKSLTVLYLKDGTVYAVSDFWVADAKLVYNTSYGAQNSIPLDQLDLEQTVKANAARGVPFTLKSKPGPATAPGGVTPVPNPQPPATPQPQSSQPPNAMQDSQ